MKELYFDNVKEPRDGYFVKYCPPGGDVRFALLRLVFSKDPAATDAKRAMEKEADYWLHRYDVPVLVAAFDSAGRVVRIHSSIEHDYLLAWKEGTDSQERHWELLKDEQIPSTALSTDNLLSIYHGIPYRTDEDVKAAADESLEAQRKERRLLVGIIFIWAVAVPATIAILGWANPIIGAAATLYALGRAGKEGAVLLGFAKRTVREQEDGEKKRCMEHYYYHCERNPDAFQRLKAENFRSDGRERRRREAEELTKP